MGKLLIFLAVAVVGAVIVATIDTLLGVHFPNGLAGVVHQVLTMALGAALIAVINRE